MSDRPNDLITLPLHLDFNDRKMDECDRCGRMKMLLLTIDKGLCLECYKQLFRDGGLIAYIE